MRKLGLAAVIAILAACGGSSGGSGATVWSCNIASAGICVELAGPAPASDQAQLQTQCASLSSFGAVYGTTACPTASRLAGQCNIPPPSATPGETATGYLYPPQTAATAPTTCATPQSSGGLGGTWAP